VWSAREIEFIDSARGPLRALTSEAERNYSKFMLSRPDRARIGPPALRPRSAQEPSSQRHHRRRPVVHRLRCRHPRATTFRGFRTSPPVNLWDTTPQQEAGGGEFRVNTLSTVTYGDSCAIVGVSRGAAGIVREVPPEQLWLSGRESYVVCVPHAAPPRLHRCRP